MLRLEEAENLPRTNRLLPRLAAVLLLIVCGVVLMGGIGVLRNAERIEPTIFEGLIGEKRQKAVVKHAPTGVCLAIVDSAIREIKGAKMLVLNVRTMGPLRRFGTGRVLRLQAQFSDYRVLRYLYGELRSRQHHFVLEFPDKNPGMVRNLKRREQLKGDLRWPHGVLLLERDGKETLSLPRELARVLALPHNNDLLPRYNIERWSWEQEELCSRRFTDLEQQRAMQESLEDLRVVTRRVAQYLGQKEVR